MWYTSHVRVLHSVGAPWYGCTMNENEMTLQDLDIAWCPMCDTYTRTESCQVCDATACTMCGQDENETQHYTEWVHLACDLFS